MTDFTNEMFADATLNPDPDMGSSPVVTAVDETGPEREGCREPPAGPADRATTRRRRGATLIGCVVLASIIVVAALARTSEGRRITASLGIRTAQEPYTALSFVDPATLGFHDVHYSGPRVYDRIGFVIADEQHAPITYRWTVSFTPAWQQDHGSVTVAAGQSATVTTRVALPCNRRVGPGATKPRRVQVQVSLAPSSDRIDFWQACGG